MVNTMETKENGNKLNALVVSIYIFILHDSYILFQILDRCPVCVLSDFFSLLVFNNI